MTSAEATEGVTAAPPVASPCHKEALCYQCALRMSMLFNYPPPPTLGQLRQANAATSPAPSERLCPILDDAHHPHFTILHETATSAQRYFDGALPTTTVAASSTSAADSTPGEESEAKKSTGNGSTAYGMLAGDAAAKFAVSWLCTACMGLYQFIDLIHAPLAAAEVRASPYFDSAAITINVNVNRSFTFTWLAVATRYFDAKGTGVDRPAATSIVKEELSNFKDFYMSDLRARILPYLLHPHSDVVASATSPAAISRSTALPGINVYIDAVKSLGPLSPPVAAAGTTEEVEDAQVIKRPRVETANEVIKSAAAVSPENSVVGKGAPLEDALLGATATDSAAAREASPARPVLRALQGFRYSGNSESLVGEVFCRHHATEGLITEGYLPAVYCGNRSTEVLPYSVIYDYAVPYLTQIGWLSSPAKGEGSVAMEKTGAEGGASGGAACTEDRRATPRTAATVSCQLQHANIFLMGNYCKMMRNMSQSPWFLNGQRIGSYSLQEVIANPVLPFFFPDLPSVPPGAQQEGGSRLHSSNAKNSNHSSDISTAPGVEGDKEEGSGEGTTTSDTPTPVVGAERGAHASRWQAVAPSVASSSLVFGYNRYKFHSAGREDVDVRMLGDGRPFVLELVSPLREQFSEVDLRHFEQAINASYIGSVEVSRLRRTDAEVTVRLARHSESKVKRYRCVVWCSRAIDDAATDPQVQAIHAMTDLTIAQKTPLRVLHRRSLHPRPRLIHSMKLTQLNAHWFLLDLETQAGTYVKEFVHGDMGRTTPHLGMLLNARTDIIQLDVVGMAMHDLDHE